MDHSDLVKEHFNIKYQDYDSLITKLIPNYEEMHKVVLDNFDFSQEKSYRFLDLGIGTGKTTLELLEKFPNCTVDGIDISENMLNQAKIRLENFSNRVDFKLADMKNLELAKKYSGCVAVLSIHHLNAEEKQSLFEKIFNNLSLGGIFSIGDIINFNNSEETKNKENEWKQFLIRNLGDEEGNYWFDNYLEEDLPNSSSDQVDWLLSAGFQKVEIKWEYMNYAVLKATKQV